MRHLQLHRGGLSHGRPTFELAVSTETPKSKEANPMTIVTFIIGLMLVLFGVQAQAETVHRVKSGETVSKIANRYGTNWKQVCERNSLKNCNHIRPGQKLVIPQGTASTAKPAAVKPAIRPVAQVSSGEFVWHVVGGSPLKNCGKKSVAAINEEAWVALGLTAEERDELSALVALSGDEPRITGGNRVKLGTGMKFPAVTFCKGGKAVARTPVLSAWPSDQGVFGERFVLSTGKRLIWVRNCHNWVLDTPAPPEVPAPVVPPLPAPVTPPVEPAAEPLKPISAIPAKGEEEWSLRAKLKYEVIAGSWIGGTGGLSKWHGHYVEGLLLAELDDGYEVGVGLYGMRGYGRSKTSPYSWREGNGWGPQIALKRNYEKEQTDEFNQTLLLPAGWEVKARFVHDKVTGGNPVSGYSMQQTGKKFGLYAGYYEQRGYDWIYGATAEAWWSYDRHIQSTWTGDNKAQDRGSVELAAFAQYRIDDTWQVRGIAGLSHQNWDKLNYLNLAAEVRWNETIMCGPRLAFALNKGIHVDASWHDLNARMFYCRVELGDTIRAHLRSKNIESVQYIGPVSAHVTVQTE